MYALLLFDAGRMFQNDRTMTELAKYDAKTKEDAVALLLQDKKTLGKMYNQAVEELDDEEERKIVFLGQSFTTEDNIQTIMNTLSTRKPSVILDEIENTWKQGQMFAYCLVDVRDTLYQILCHRRVIEK